MDDKALQRYNIAVTSVYDAALDPSATDHSLQQILTFANASAGSLLRVSSQGDLLELTARNHSPAAQAAYSAHYHSLDPGVESLVSSRPGQWIMDTDTFDPRQTAHREYVYDFCFQHDIRWAAGVKVHQDAEQFTILSLQRGHTTPSFRESGAQALGLLLPHVHRAAELKARLGTAFDQRGVITAMLDRLAAPTFAVTTQGLVVFANRAAEELLAAGTTFKVQAMRLTSNDDRLSAGLKAAIRRACNSPATGSAFMAGAQGSDTQQIHVTPITPRLAESSFRPEPLAMVLISDTASSAPDALTVQALLDLTPSQAQVAAGLAAGETLAVIAARMSVTLNTVRTHLARVFERTGVHTQSQLVALARSLPRVRR